VCFLSKVANFNPPHLYLSPPYGVITFEFPVNFGVRKLLESQGHRAIVWHYLRDPTFSRFDTIQECDRQTHTQTDR